MGPSLISIAVTWESSTPRGPRPPAGFRKGPPCKTDEWRDDNGNCLTHHVSPIESLLANHLRATRAKRRKIGRGNNWRRQIWFTFKCSCPTGGGGTRTAIVGASHCLPLALRPFRRTSSGEGGGRKWRGNCSGPISPKPEDPRSFWRDFIHPANH